MSSYHNAAEPNPAIGRRGMLGVALATIVATVSPAALWAAVAAGAAPPISTPKRQLLERVCDLVIPATETLGALGVGVPDFLLLALAHGLSGEHHPAGSTTINTPAAPTAPVGDLDLVDRLETLLNQQAGGNFVALMPTAQIAILTRVDQAAYAQGAPPGDWSMIKALIMTGYYTSEVGASKELQYELDPGRWDPNIKLPPNNRSWSSDWTAATFG